jgi:uncharacterized protein (TIGR02118 family)
MSDYGRNAEVIIFVTYQGTAESRFDRVYYGERHVPMLRRLFGPLGLTSAQAFFPVGQESGTIAICECRYRDEAAFADCYASSDMPGLAADIGNFTDIMPVQLRATR